MASAGRTFQTGHPPLPKGGPGSWPVPMGIPRGVGQGKAGENPIQRTEGDRVKPPNGSMTEGSRRWRSLLKEMRNMEQASKTSYTRIFC